MASKRSSKASRKHKKTRATRAAAPPAPLPPKWSLPRGRLLGVLALAGLGVILTAYLTLNAWFGSSLPYCSAGSACDIVQSSRWSTLLGLPVAFWGLLTYAGIALLACRADKPAKRWKLLWTLASVGLAVSVYLTAISIFVIDATCAYCLASLALIAAIFALVAWAGPDKLPAFRWREWLPLTAGGAGVLVLLLHLHYSGVFDPAAGPEDPRLRALAVHLQESGAKFYGAYWCPHCEDQKALFAASADRLPYVECTPDGRGGMVALACATRNISNYPTWIIDGRRYPGVLEPRTLARLSGFSWEQAQRE